jgi:translation elongation factor EF-1alpha
MCPSNANIGLNIRFGSAIQKGVIIAHNKTNPTQSKNLVGWINIMENERRITMIYYETKADFDTFHKRIVAGLKKQLGEKTVGVVRAYIHHFTE